MPIELDRLSSALTTISTLLTEQLSSSTNLRRTVKAFGEGWNLHFGNFLGVYGFRRKKEKRVSSSSDDDLQHLFDLNYLCVLALICLGTQFHNFMLLFSLPLIKPQRKTFHIGRWLCPELWEEESSGNVYNIFYTHRMLALISFNFRVSERQREEHQLTQNSKEKELNFFFILLLLGFYWIWPAHV